MKSFNNEKNVSKLWMVNPRNFNMDYHNPFKLKVDFFSQCVNTMFLKLWDITLWKLITLKIKMLTIELF
jgi:hypothetical protein